MEFLLYALFFLSAILLIFVVLMQEPKGGGLSEAFGGAGAETFGPRAGGINRFTFGLFAVWIVSALGLHWIGGDPDAGSVGSTLNSTQPTPPAISVPEIPEESNQ